MLRRRTAALISLGAATVAWSAIAIAPPGARAAGKDRRYTNAKYGVTVDAPSGWTMSPHTGYPDILVLLLHPSGARISLAASDTTLASARDVVERNRKGLEAQGLTIVETTSAPRDGVQLDAQSRTGADRVRQYYVVRTGDGHTRQALVLTLTTPAALLSTMAPTFSTLVARLLADTASTTAPPSK